jgi:4-amino-4-deoxy-L-arabinose transferase-like glycosyltransferase
LLAYTSKHDPLATTRENGWIHFGILASFSAFAFFWNLNVPFYEGTEGFYADITREMVQSGQYWHLTYQGQPYAFKPPLFFWLIAWSISVFGENEFAHRVPGSLFCVATMILTYRFGRMLFSKTAGFWAALAISTTYSFLWYGRRVLIDSAVTFFITLALFALIKAYAFHGKKTWYVLGFIAMALGAMTKGFHAFLLPIIVMGAFLAVQKDVAPFKERFVWIGVAFAFLLTGAYYWILGDIYIQRFVKGETLNHVFSIEGLNKYVGARPFYWYLTVMWFDFFPWIVLAPYWFVQMFQHPELRRTPSQQLILLWIAGFLLALSLAQDKRESYLLPIVPALALMVGSCSHLIEVQAYTQRRSAQLLLRGLLLLLSIVSAGLFLGPTILHGTLFVSLPLFPIPFVVVMLGACLFLLYASMKPHSQMTFPALGVLATCFVVAIVQFILPAMISATSSKDISARIEKSLMETPAPLFVYLPGKARIAGKGEVVYYLRPRHSMPEIRTEEALLEQVQKDGLILVLLEKGLSQRVALIRGLATEVRAEFHQRRQELVLMLIKPAAQATLQNLSGSSSGPT